jgi:uncharacterized repeat protein (TIGR03803 family)
LVQGSDGSLYGVTLFGVGYDGTVFKATPSGTVTTLHVFTGSSTDGSGPRGPLIQGSDGNFYGVTDSGGSFFSGIIFRITPSGGFSLIHSFNPPTDGHNQNGGLIQDSQGNFYGTTQSGGANTVGTVFQATAAGGFTTLHSFSKIEGPSYGGLVQGTDGNFYGATLGSGFPANGTIFRITPNGAFTTLYSFNGSVCSDPQTTLIQASDGNLFGMTLAGGTDPCNCGTIFNVSLNGALTSLLSFGPATTGTAQSPAKRLLQDTNGDFYAVSLGGPSTRSCANGCGVIFRFTTGLGPFVAPTPRFGSAGAAVQILGTNLTNSSSVTFNGTPAVFKVVGPGFIRATVPPGATTGSIQVTTPSGTLTSNVPFQVTP